MLQFFESFSEFLDAIWQMIVNIFSSLVTAVDVLGSVIVLPALLTGFVPGFLGSCIIIVFAVGIVKLLVGWGNS